MSFALTTRYYYYPGASKKQLGKFAFLAQMLEIGLLTLRFIGRGMVR